MCVGGTAVVIVNYNGYVDTEECLELPGSDPMKYNSTGRTVQCGRKRAGSGWIFLYRYIGKDECEGSNRTV